MGCVSAKGTVSRKRAASLKHRENTHIFNVGKNSKPGDEDDEDNESEASTVINPAEFKVRSEAPFTRTDMGEYETKKHAGDFTCAAFAGYDFQKRKVCQDAYLVKKMATGDGKIFNLFTIFDGHGQFGEKVAKRLCEIFPTNLERKSKVSTSDPEIFEKNFSQAFINTDNEMRKEWPMFLMASGATCTAVALFEDLFFVGFLGDSRAVLAKEEDGKIVHEDLTFAHHFNDKVESSRVHKAGGIVRRGYDGLGNEVGPLRVYQKPPHRGPGLAVSRSFGDSIGKNLGVSCVPSTKWLGIKPNDLFIIIASDGVWDMMSSKEAIQKVYECKTTEAAQLIIRSCAERWVEVSEGLSDDISCIIVYINYKPVKHRKDFGLSKESNPLDALPLGQIPQSKSDSFNSPSKPNEKKFDFTVQNKKKKELEGNDRSDSGDVQIEEINGDKKDVENDVDGKNDGDKERNVVDSDDVVLSDG